MEAAEHPKQAARLAALRGYEILDTPEEEAFDEITQLASEICETPISVVNLIDAGRQWFKAEVGLGVRETPLATSLCSHAILEEDFVEIPDTLEDARMRDNPLCVGAPGLRFYAGALLKTAEGLPLGTLCVLDHRPRRLTPLQRNALQVLARQVMARLDLRLALKRQRLMLKEIDHRVKNSLAAIMAVIRIQLRGSEDEGVNAALRDVETRIGRIALLHEQLYRASSAHEIDFADYIVRVGEMLRGSIPDSIRIETEADPFLGDARQACQFGVVMTEFVMNSAKHAFPDGRPGSIRIALRHGAEDEIELRCQDDGVGHPNGAIASKGIGLRLMQASAAQAGGDLEILRGNAGFGVVVRAPARLSEGAAEA